MSESNRRRDNESHIDYMVRLFENKNAYGITCNNIADLLNNDSGNHFGECTYRKYYKAFRDGRLYERNQSSCPDAIRILSISDLHIPFQLPLHYFEKYAGRVDILQLNGDIVDCAAISKFSKVRRASTMDDILSARGFLIDLIDMLRPNQVVCNYGNHDIRFERYLADRLQNDLIELMPRTPLELIFCDGISHYNKDTRAKTFYEPLTTVFPDVEIQYIDNWYVQIGKTIFCHPLSYKSGPMRTTEAAVRFFRNEGMDFDTVVMAHTHHIGNYVVGKTMLFEQGAGCDTSQLHYADGKLADRQSEGYLYLEHDLSGALINYDQEILGKGANQLARLQI